MKILVVGSTGTIGSGVKQRLIDEGHEVIATSYRMNSDMQVDITNTDSVKNMFKKIGFIDAIVSTVGGDGFIKPFEELTDEDFRTGLISKVMGQVNLVTIGRDYINKGGSITLTSGLISVGTMPGMSLIGTANAAINNFIQALAIEVKADRFRINTVIPNLVTESALRYNVNTEGTLSSEETSETYSAIIHGAMTGRLIKTGGSAREEDFI